MNERINQLNVLLVVQLVQHVCYSESLGKNRTGLCHVAESGTDVPVCPTCAYLVSRIGSIQARSSWCPFAVSAPGCSSFLMCCVLLAV